MSDPQDTARRFGPFSASTVLFIVLAVVISAIAQGAILWILLALLVAALIVLLFQFLNRRHL